jgi:hypothetical protein
MLDLPPDIVDDALRYPFESFLVPQHVHDSSRAEGVSSSNHVFGVYSVLPGRPVDSFKTMSTGGFVALLSHVLRGDLFTLARVDDVNELVSFFNLCYAQVQLPSSEFLINSFVVVRTCVPRVVYYCQYLCLNI